MNQSNLHYGSLKESLSNEYKKRKEKNGGTRSYDIIHSLYAKISVVKSEMNAARPAEARKARSAEWRAKMKMKSYIRRGKLLRYVPFMRDSYDQPVKKN